MHKPRLPPIFFDPSFHRWRRVMRVVTVAIVAVVILLGAVMVAVSINPGLPPLGLDTTKVIGKRAEMTPAVIAAREVRFDAARKQLDQHLKRSLPPLPAIPRGEFERIAFYVN